MTQSQSEAATVLQKRDNPAPPGYVVDTVVTDDGMRLRSVHWPAFEGSAKGTVLILQGRTEFTEKYFETIADLRRRRFAVATFDWRGQGRSQREIAGHCHVESYADYDRDLDAVMRRIVLPDCPRPLCLLGVSMGALVGLRAARDGRARFDRIVLLAPMIELSRHSAPPMGLMRLLAAIGLFLGRDTKDVGNRALRARYADFIEEPRRQRLAALLREAPELQTGHPTVRWLYSSLEAMRGIESASFARQIAAPVLAVVAGRDRLVSNDAIARFVGDLRFGAQIIVAGARHEILLEPDPIREEFWAAFDAFVPGGDPYANASAAAEDR
jgi:lysophospholipase